jgi:hypothetical protein
MGGRSLFLASSTERSAVAFRNATQVSQARATHKKVASHAAARASPIRVNPNPKRLGMSMLLPVGDHTGSPLHPDRVDYFISSCAWDFREEGGRQKAEGYSPQPTAHSRRAPFSMNRKF